MKPRSELCGRLSLLAALVLLCTSAAADDKPLQALPYVPSLDTSAMDRSIDPCEDLYQYACGGWIKNNPIPADQSRWSVYAKMADENQRYLWGVLNTLADASGKLSADQARMGDYFAACMDESAVDARGLTPLAPLLTSIDGLKNKRELPALLAALQLATGNSRLFFGFGPAQDYADSQRVIAFATAGGTSLPERDYYLKGDAKSVKLRAQFSAHVAALLVKLGASPAASKAQAARVLAIETALARASLAAVDKRNPYKLFHAMDAQALAKLTPHFDWRAFEAALGLPAQERYNVTEPAFFEAFDQQLAALSLADIKTYLRWQLASSLAGTLSSDVAQLSFDFFQKTLHGTPQQKPRWKRCVGLVDAQLGEALGREFVERNFSPALKAKTVEMTEQIEVAMAARIRELPWMSAATKARALEKLGSIVNKVGYPDSWRDYGALQVARDDFAGNVQRGHAFELRRQLAKIGKPLDRGEWQMTPQTVNAYYDAQMNDINFPAGVLQPPLYDPKSDAAPNYGNTGGTIGHELVHGFDDEGRQFDARGNLKDWWGPADAKAFETRAACVVEQYAKYTVVDDIKLNSKLTLGEDLADLGGLVLALVAWQSEMTRLGLPLDEKRDGLSPAQRFFVGFAQWDCNDARPEALRVQARTNPHSPGRYRINGVVVNMPEFAQAFHCKPGQALVKPAKQRCQVW